MTRWSDVFCNSWWMTVTSDCLWTFENGWENVTSTGHNLKWDHFDILARGKADTHCKIKETLSGGSRPSDKGGPGHPDPEMYVGPWDVCWSIRDVCWSIRDVKFDIITVSYTMRLLFLMFVTAVCVLFLKLRWLFWSEIGSGFGKRRGTAPPRIPRSTLRTNVKGRVDGCPLPSPRTAFSPVPLSQL